MTDLLPSTGVSATCQQWFNYMQVISYYTQPWGNVSLSLHVWRASVFTSSVDMCNVQSCVCQESTKKRRQSEAWVGGGAGRKWFESVSVAANLLNHLPPSNKIEHRAEPNNCQTPRHHLNGEEISGEQGRGCFSMERRWKHFNVRQLCGRSVKESSKSPCQVNQDWLLFLGVMEELNSICGVGGGSRSHKHTFTSNAIWKKTHNIFYSDCNYKD